LDVSPGETAICVIDATGASVEEMRAEVAPGALDDALVRLDLPLERVGMAACSLAAWLHDGLAEAGWPAICIEAQQAAPWGCGDPTASRGAAMKTMPHESDRNNPRALLWGAGSPQPRTVAQIMRKGVVSPGACEEPPIAPLALAPGGPAHGVASHAQHRERDRPRGRARARRAEPR
jgi:hypothetical protein